MKNILSCLYFQTRLEGSEEGGGRVGRLEWRMVFSGMLCLGLLLLFLQQDVSDYSLKRE